MTGTIMDMAAPSDVLMSEIKATSAAKRKAVAALSKAQAEYLEADRLRKQAARTVLDTPTGHTQDQAAEALGFSTRSGLLRLASETKPAGGYVFAGDVLEELRKLAARYERAVTGRRELVRTLRKAPPGERLTLPEMGAAMGLTAEGVRYLTRGAK